MAERRTVPVSPFVARGQLAPCRRRLFVHCGRVGQELLPGVRQRVTARASREQARSQRLFQPCDAPMNGGRVDAQGCRCRRQASAARDGQEQLEVRPVDRLLRSCIHAR